MGKVSYWLTISYFIGVQIQLIEVELILRDSDYVIAKKSSVFRKSSIYFVFMIKSVALNILSTIGALYLVV